MREVAGEQEKGELAQRRVEDMEKYKSKRVLRRSIARIRVSQKSAVPGAPSNFYGRWLRIGCIGRSAFAASGLNVGFDEPEVFVHFAGHGGEQVHSDGIVQVLGFLDGRAQGVGKMADIVDQELDHFRPIGGSQVGFRQARFGGGFADRSVSDSAQSGDAFGDGVNVIFKMRGYRIEEQVQLVEVLALHIPMRPLHLAMDIRAVGKAEIEQGNQRLAVLVGNTNGTGVRANGSGSCFSHRNSPLLGWVPMDWMK